jgi:LysM repeat protein
VSLSADKCTEELKVARKYRYRTFKARKKHNTAYFILAVIVIIIVVFFLVKFGGGPDDTAPVDIPDTEIVDTQPEQEQPQPEIPEPVTEEIVPEEAKTEEKETVETTITEQETVEGEVEQIPPEPDSDEFINPQAKALIAEALQDVNAGNIIAARDKLDQTLEMGLNPKILSSVKAQMATLAEKWLFSRDAFPGDTLTGLYEVQHNDSLSEIGKKYKVPHEILQQINNIPDPKKLREGQKIKVVNGPFHAIVYKSTFTLDLYLQNTYVKSYKVGLGMEGKETPTGKWRVKAGGKLLNPTWRDPDTGRTYIADDPDYPLGSRWIAIEGLEGNALGRTGFAFHGTKDPETIGTRSSKGCIRLFNGDVIELYNLVVPVDSKVNVVD